MSELNKKNKFENSRELSQLNSRTILKYYVEKKQHKIIYHQVHYQRQPGDQPFPM